MRQSKYIIVIGLLCVVGPAGFRYAAAVPFSNVPAAAECRFKLRSASASPVVIGPEDLTALVRFVTQRDSPVAVSRIDFSGAPLSVGGAAFSFENAYSVEVINLSDQVVRNVRAMVQVRSRGGAAGGGPATSGPLAPGDRRTLYGGGGMARGTAESDDVRILVGIDSVEFGTCAYRPSQTLPLFGKPLS